MYHYVFMEIYPIEVLREYIDEVLLNMPDVRLQRTKKR